MFLGLILSLIIILIFLSLKLTGYMEKILRFLIRLLLMLAILYVFVHISYQISILIGDFFEKGSDIISNVFYHMFLAASLVFSFYLSPKIDELLFFYLNRKKDS